MTKKRVESSECGEGGRAVVVEAAREIMHTPLPVHFFSFIVRKHKTHTRKKMNKNKAERLREIFFIIYQFKTTSEKCIQRRRAQNDDEDNSKSFSIKKS